MSFYYSKLAGKMYPHLAEAVEYPKAGNTVDGLEVRSETIPNYSSIEASFTDYEVLPGIRELPFSDFADPKKIFYAKNDWDWSEELAEKIKESGWVSPLIIAIDEKGPYILEGAHRFVALGLYLGKESFPALVVKDLDTLSEARQAVMELINRNEPEGEPRVVLAYRDSVWLFSRDDEEISRETSDQLENDGIINHSVSTVYELQEILDDSPRPDVVFGYLKDKSLFLSGRGESVPDPKSSPLIKKLVKHLGLRLVDREDISGSGDQVTTFRYEIEGKIPSLVYHGTSSVYLDKILRVGLIPGKSPSNWISKYNKIEHPYTVFFSSKIDKATFHAVHTSEKVGGDPVILVLSIPDKTKMIPDYDIANLDASLGNEMQMSDLAGIWGYEGNIYPGHIKEVQVCLGSENYADKWEAIAEAGFTRLDKDQIQNYLEYGDPDYEPEEEEDPE